MGRDLERVGVSLRLLEHRFEAAEGGDHSAVIGAKLRVGVGNFKG